LLRYLVLLGVLELFWLGQALPEGTDLFGLVCYRVALGFGYRES
jgi:hypothetical protein